MIEQLQVEFQYVKHKSSNNPYWGVLSFTDANVPGKRVDVRSPSWPWKVSELTPGFSACVKIERAPPTSFGEQFTLIDLQQTTDQLTITTLTSNRLATHAQAKALFEKFGDDAITALQRVVQGKSSIDTLVIPRRITHERAQKLVRAAACLSLHEFELRIALINSGMSFLKFPDIEILCSSFPPDLDPYEFIEKFKVNPFRLFYKQEKACECEEACSCIQPKTFSVKRMREISHELKIPGDDTNFIVMEVFVLMKEWCNKGHMYMEENSLCREYANNCQILLKAAPHVVKEAIANSCSFVVKEHPTTRDMCVYLKTVHSAETFVLNKIRRMVKPMSVPLTLPDKLTSGLVQGQVEALRTMCTQNLCVVTGSAGTGKTTLVRSFVEVLEHNKVAFTGLAFTGKAARNLQEKTGVACRTIDAFHIGLDTRPDSISTDRSVVVVDEASMVHVPLAMKILMHVSDDTPVVFIGDINQLPPVMINAYGFFFSTLVNTPQIPRAELTQVHRNGGGILTVANAVISDNLSMRDFLPRDGFKMAHVKSYEIGDRVMKELKLRNWHDARVVCQTNKLSMKFNVMMQQEFNPSSEQVRVKLDDGNTWNFRTGDPVMCTKNITNRTRSEADSPTILYEIGHSLQCICSSECKCLTRCVFTNGMSGEVTSVSGRGVYIKFDDEACLWPDHLISKFIVPAYAMTIHKSQGSEYKHGVVVVEYSYNGSFRSSLYTGITRFKETCIVVGIKECIERIIKSPINDTFQEMMVELLEESL